VIESQMIQADWPNAQRRRWVPDEGAAVPGRRVNAGNSRSLPGHPAHRLTCGQAGQPAAQSDLWRNLGASAWRAAAPAQPA